MYFMELELTYCFLHILQGVHPQAVLKNCLPLDGILKAEGGRSMKTFAQFYDKPIETIDSNVAYNV